MPILTMTTDFGLRDYYAALVKGAVLCQNENINIVDISHNVNNYDIVQAAFIFKNAWQAFPVGSIHLISVNDFNAKHLSFVAIKYKNHFFIGPDNGLFSLVFDELPHEVVSLPLVEEGRFPLKDIYARAVGMIAAGQPLTEIGQPIEQYNRRITFQPVTSKDQIRGSVIHIDKYDNAIVNIHRELFEQIGNDRSFSLYFKRHDPITNLCRHYHEMPVGEILCLFNSANLLEIAINKGKASTLLGLNLEDTVQLKFHDA